MMVSFFRLSNFLGIFEAVYIYIYNVKKLKKIIIILKKKAVKKERWVCVWEYEGRCASGHMGTEVVPKC